jgi:hypothetical protein
VGRLRLLRQRHLTKLLEAGYHLHPLLPVLMVQQTGDGFESQWVGLPLPRLLQATLSQPKSLEAQLFLPALVHAQSATSLSAFSPISSGLAESLHSLAYSFWHEFLVGPVGKTSHSSLT